MTPSVDDPKRKGESGSLEVSVPESREESPDTWTRVTEGLFLHPSGARIERRGYPISVGWYLSGPDLIPRTQRFDPTLVGCDRAFLVFGGLWTRSRMTRPRQDAPGIPVPRDLDPKSFPEVR
jgi:hypothetical protein